MLVSAQQAIENLVKDLDELRTVGEEEQEAKATYLSANALLIRYLLNTIRGHWSEAELEHLRHEDYRLDMSGVDYLLQDKFSEIEKALTYTYRGSHVRAGLGGISDYSLQNLKRALEYGRHYPGFAEAKVQLRLYPVRFLLQQITAPAEGFVPLWLPAETVIWIAKHLEETVSTPEGWGEVHLHVLTGIARNIS